jgi:4-carboxymuconolactone decarboxylase
MADKSPGKSPQPEKKLPRRYKSFIEKFPLLGAAHDQVAKAVDTAGPLNHKQCELIKIGICLGAGLESALRSHVRKALEHGATVTEIEQTVLLGMNTCGFPRTVAAWSWAWQQIERED